MIGLLFPSSWKRKGGSRAAFIAETSAINISLFPFPIHWLEKIKKQILFKILNKAQSAARIIPQTAAVSQRFGFYQWALQKIHA